MFYYETKNAYSFTVRATDAAGNTADRTVTVSVVNKDEVAPSFTSATTGSALENQAALYTAVSTDTVDYVGGSTSYSLVAGGDAAALTDRKSVGEGRRGWRGRGQD